MIEIRNLHLPLTGGKAFGVAYDPARLRVSVARKLGCEPEELDLCTVVRRSVDARKARDVHYVATVRASLVKMDSQGEERLVERLASNDIVMAKDTSFELPRLAEGYGLDSRPVVVGAGAAGLFAAVALAEAGLAPILIERGAPAAERGRDVDEFVRTGRLNLESNIQFGAGGAGTFSDGKLTTGTSSPAHAWISQAFVEAGASPDILWQAGPHIGSDVLPTVVENLVARIERAGGEVRWHTRMTELVVEHGVLAGIRTVTQTPNGSVNNGLACTYAIMACGHSARDVFVMLDDLGLTLEPKVFSMGVRIEHPQHMINKIQYGGIAGSDALPPASYKLNCRLRDGRGVYTFCMCPGGTVVAATSDDGCVVTNGMSNFARDGRNANAGLLVTVEPSDIPGIADDVLAGIDLQYRCERAAFEAGGGAYAAPAQLVGDFLGRHNSRAGGSIKPSYPLGVRWGSVGRVLPDFVDKALRAAIPILGRKFEGFDRPDAVLTGVETRSSSPVRVMRDGSCQSIDVRGLYPCGEGAGYAGGIMSAAADGLRCAAALVEAVNEG